MTISTGNIKYFSEAMFLAFASAVAYSVAYAYRSAYEDFFGVPFFRMTPSIADVLRGVAAVGIGLAAFYVWVDHFSVFLPKNETAIARGINKAVMFWILASIFILKLTEGWVAFGLVVLALFACLSVQVWIPGYVFKRDLPTVEERIAAHEKADKEMKARTLTDRLMNTFGLRNFTLVFSSFIIIFLAYLTGAADARRQTSYYVVEGKDNYVAIRIEDDYIVLVGYDDKTKSIKNEVRLLKLNDDKVGISLKKVEIGRLRPYGGRSTGVTGITFVVD